MITGTPRGLQIFRKWKNRAPTVWCIRFICLLHISVRCRPKYHNSKSVFFIFIFEEERSIIFFNICIFIIFLVRALGEINTISGRSNYDTKRNQHPLHWPLTPKHRSQSSQFIMHLPRPSCYQTALSAQPSCSPDCIAQQRVHRAALSDHSWFKDMRHSLQW